MSPTYTLEQLTDILEFKREVMNQMVLVSTPMAAVAVSVVTILVSSAERSRLRSGLVIAFMSCSLPN